VFESVLARVGFAHRLQIACTDGRVAAPEAQGGGTCTALVLRPREPRPDGQVRHRSSPHTIVYSIH
jgi:hypothetical protein